MTFYFQKIVFIIAILTSLISCNQVFDTNKNTMYFGGEIINPNSRVLYLLKNNEIIDTIQLDEKNRFFKKYDSLTPGMYSFRHDPEYQYIYFDKNDSLMIRLNTNDFDNSLTFCGRGDEKNNFLMELFLKNEKNKNDSFDLFDKDYDTFSKKTNQNYQVNNAFYNRRKSEINWDSDFDVYANAMLQMPYFTKKEMYPLLHKKRTSNGIALNLPKNYYNFRNDIQFNNEKLTTFSPFVRYLTAMLNNSTYNNKMENTLQENINKLNVADSIFTNQKTKNAILNNIAFMYLLEDQNMTNNKAFLKKYFKLSTDTVKKQEIKNIENSIQKLLIGNYLPNVELIDSTKQVQNLKILFPKKTVLFFWTSEAKSHLELVHQRVSELKQKHPNWNFVSVNIDDSENKWLEMLKKYQFKNTTELHAKNFAAIKNNWVITKIHRAMLLDAGGKINNAFVSIFDADFENKLH
jgi:hypothetical protein